MRQGCRIIKIGDANAIICGGEPNDHKCNEDSSVLILSDGERMEATDENYDKYKEQITGGSVACSICGRAAIDNAHWLEC